MARKRGRVKPANRWKKVLRLLTRVFLWFVALSVLWVLAYRFINPPLTYLMVERAVARKIDGRPWKIEKSWRGMDELSDNLKLAAVAGEDARFFQHWGFDLQAIEKAYEKNQAGARLRGGSTISQQTAKNVFLWPGRSYIRKAFEAYFTVLIELLWPKERILEVYLNVIETGDGFYGAEAAAVNYFNKTSESLTRGQAALIIAILPNPRRWSAAKPTRFIYYKQSLILRNMRQIRSLPTGE